MDSREIVFYRDDGRVFRVGDSQPWKFSKGSNKLDGFTEFSGAASQVENYSTDGGRIERIRLSPKDRTIGIAYTDIANNKAARNTFTAFFIYNMSYNIYVTYMGVTRWARGRLYKMWLSDDAEDYLQKAKMTFKFENPYWLSLDNFGKDIASIVPMVAFPYISPVGIGLPAGKFEFDQQVEIVNDADADTYPVITVKAKGNVTNPAIIINGEQVKLTDALTVGDEVIFNFEAIPPTIKKNGVNALGLCDRTSNFDAMYFARGDNTISYDADDGSTNMSVSVKFYKKYALI